MSRPTIEPGHLCCSGLVRAEGSAVLMDAPPGKGDDPAVFAAMASYLQQKRQQAIGWMEQAVAKNPQNRFARVVLQRRSRFRLGQIEKRLEIPGELSTTQPLDNDNNGLIDDGVPLHGVGLQTHRLSTDGPDRAQFQAFLQDYADLGGYISRERGRLKLPGVAEVLKAHREKLARELGCEYGKDWANFGFKPGGR